MENRIYQKGDKKSPHLKGETKTFPPFATVFIAWWYNRSVGRKTELGWSYES